MNVPKAIEIFQAKFEHSISELAAEYSKKILVPLCKKQGIAFRHGVAYHSGYSGFVRYDGNGHVAWSVFDKEECIEKKRRFLIKYFDILDIPVGNGSFGDYCPEIDESGNIIEPEHESVTVQ